MKIRDAYITFAKGDRPIKAGMILEKDDLVESCEIDGGRIEKINREENTNILFNSCYIENCEYTIKELKEEISPCSIVDSCIIKNCKLPTAYYVNCTFEKKEAIEHSIPYS